MQIAFDRELGDMQKGGIESQKNFVATYCAGTGDADKSDGEIWWD